MSKAVSQHSHLIVQKDSDCDGMNVPVAIHHGSPHYFMFGSQR